MAISSSIETQFISLIHSSKTTKNLRQTHAQIIRHNAFSSRVISQLISSSSLLKSIDYALSIFRHCDSESRNLFAFNSLISGLTKNSRFEDSISQFIEMSKLGVKPDKLTYPFVLKSCASLGFGWFGKAVHCVVVKCGVEFNYFVRETLVEMYVKCTELGFALQVFDESPESNKRNSILLWNVLINGFCKVGNLDKATELFETMHERNNGSWNCLLDGFMKNGDLSRAMEHFDRIPEKNVVSWTTAINGLSQNGDNERAVSLFTKMLEEDVRPNDFTLVSALTACAKIGALGVGERIRNYIFSNGIRYSEAAGTALVDMYAKCGDIESASEVFNETKQKNIRTWSVMIWGYAIHGCYEKAFQCFKQMMYSGIQPDGVVFLALLTACLHSGQVNLGLNFFESMRLDYSIEPTMKHYASVVDLLGRAGRLKEALNFIRKMPMNPDFVIWGALFSACRAHKNIEMAELASRRLLELEPKHPGGYVFLSNIYAAASRWEDVERVRMLMHDKGAGKDPGWSYVEVDGKVHSFLAGDYSHKHIKEIYLKLEEIMSGARQKGYMPETEWVLHNIEEEEKEDALGSHSEKLSLAFGLLSSPPGVTIRIVKNLRICGDCHSVMKYASKITQRQIVVRDIKRFHHFKNGVCSCQDYW